MKHYVFPAIVALAMAGCASQLPGQSTISANLTPTVSQDGIKGFTMRAAGTGDPAAASTAAEHQQIISQELGRRQFCMNGYDLVDTDKRMSESGSSYVITYTGRCK